MSEAALDPRALDGMELDTLREIGNIGAGNAARALSTMIDEPVDMRVPSARAVAVEHVPAELGDEDEAVAAAHLRVSGDLAGEMIYLIGPPEARRPTAMMLARTGAPPEDDDFVGLTEMQLSALQEVANVLVGTHLSALAQMTDLRMDPTPPAIGVDLARRSSARSSPRSRPRPTSPSSSRPRSGARSPSPAAASSSCRRRSGSSAS